MRYFNVRQHTEASMLNGDSLVDISQLEKLGTEINKELANNRPNWGSGNIAVNENGEWEWLATNFDISG